MSEYPKINRDVDEDGEGVKLAHEWMVPPPDVTPLSERNLEGTEDGVDD